MIVELKALLGPVASRLMKQGPNVKKALTPLMIMHSVSPVSQNPNRTLATKSLTKSLQIMTHSDNAVRGSQADLNNQLKLNNSASEERPLSVLLCWLMSEKKHILKYARFYLDQGFDVLTVRVSPWQLLWPTGGSQVVAKDVLNFMEVNKQMYSTVMLHGFSVGGYIWGEALQIMYKELQTYQPLIDRIVGQIWDSVVDFEGIPSGLSKAVFPNNNVLRASLEKYVTYHMAAFYEIATKHYYSSSKQFHDTLIKAPALFLGSMDDPVGSISNIKGVAQEWESRGIEVYLKAWDSSPHVSHLHHHPEDYKQEMKAFLEKLGLLPYPEKFALKVASASG